MQAVFNFLGWGAKRLAEMKQQKGTLLQSALQLWDKEHELETDKNEKLPKLPEGFAPTVCQLEGFGRCLCSGRGAILQLAKKRLASVGQERLRCCPAGRCLLSCFVVILQSQAANIQQHGANR